jgi:type I restriction enzyme S subunit
VSWQSTRLKFLARIPIRNGLGESGGRGEPSWPRYIRTTDIAGPRTLRDDVFASLPPKIAAGALLRSGDIVMTAAGATIGKMLLYDSDAPACYAGYLVRFRPRLDVDGRFIAYWMESQPYWDQIETGKVVSTIENFSASKYQNLRLSVPDPITQRSIADYLDRETARIDALIEKKRRLKELLQERRQTLITEAISRTRDPGTAARGDRVTVRLKVAADLMTSCVSSEVRPFVALEHLESGTGRLVADAEVPERTAPDTGAASVEPGDVLFGKLRPYLAKTWLADRPVFASTELLCLRPRAGVDSRWLAYLVASNPVVEWAVATSDGTKMPRTSWEKLAEYRMQIPPIATQRAIADYLDRETARIDALVERIDRQVALLQERRQALITAAVTGELEIPGVAA